MKFALVMPAWIYRHDRAPLADACFRSLARTRPPSERPAFWLIEKPSDYVYPLDSLRQVFDVHAVPQAVDGVEFRGISQPLVYGTDLAFADGADYVIHVNEDSLFNSAWLVALEALAGRHPAAKAWSIYRSAHTAIHAPLREAGPDVLVRSINGNGMTLSRVEWGGWGQDWRAHSWPENPREAGIVTLDYRHYLERPGERWVTKVSYLEHTGKAGTHCVEGIPEWAVDFVGEDIP